jgi:23S rRNA A1618 N6-methylase RlmF
VSFQDLSPRLFCTTFLIRLQVPNRLNYLLWIQGLLDTTSDNYADIYDPEREVLGLDIGTGASCIYPMLGCAQRPNWRFAGTGKFSFASGRARGANDDFRY